VRSLAVFPLKLEGAKGLLYVHRRDDIPFDSIEPSVAIAFAKSVQVVIQNYFLLRDISAVSQRAWALSRLQMMIQRLSSGSDQGRLLDEVARVLLYQSDAESVFLYPCDDGVFEGDPVIKGHGTSRWQGRPVYSSEALAAFLKDAYAPDGSPVLTLRVTDAPFTVQRFLDGNPYLSEYGIEQISMIVLRAASLPAGNLDQGPFPGAAGLVIAHHKGAGPFDWDMRSLEALASSAGFAIWTARASERLMRDLERRKKELSIFREVTASIAEYKGDGKLSIEDLAGLILEKALSVLRADVGALMWHNEDKQRLDSKGLYGLAKTAAPFTQELDEGILGEVVKTKRACLVEDTGNQPSYREIVPGMRSELAVPILDGQRLLGIFNVEHGRLRYFTSEDEALLTSLSLQALSAWHLADLKTELSEKERPWRSLSLLAAGLQNPNYDLATVMRLILTGVTAGEGLGYSRAMLFLLDEDAELLRGSLAVGAQTQEEAERFWAPVNEQRGLASVRK
jgi:GAF domain-containing protein